MFGVVSEIGFTKDHLAKVGAIAVEWSAIEIKLQVLLAALIGKDVALGFSATSNLGYKSIVATLRTLASSATTSIETFQPQLLALLDEAERIQPYRNAIVHASWAEGHANGGMASEVARFKGKLKNHVEIWSKEQLEQIAADCGQLLAALYEFMELHEIHEEIDAYVALQTSLGRRIERLPVVVQPRSPKSEAVIRQLLASRL